MEMPIQYRAHGPFTPKGGRVLLKGPLSKGPVNLARLEPRVNNLRRDYYVVPPKRRACRQA